MKKLSIALCFLLAMAFAAWSEQGSVRQITQPNKQMEMKAAPTLPVIEAVISGKIIIELPLGFPGISPMYSSKSKSPSVGIEPWSCSDIKVTAVIKKEADINTNIRQSASNRPKSVEVYATGGTIKSGSSCAYTLAISEPVKTKVNLNAKSIGVKVSQGNIGAKSTKYEFTGEPIGWSNPISLSPGVNVQKDMKLNIK